MLFYESASCLHGRRQKFHGKYYASIFMHFMPVDWKMKHDEVVNRVPPHWHDDTVEDQGNRWAGQVSGSSIHFIMMVMCMCLWCSV